MRKNRIRPGGPFIKAPILAAGDDLTIKRAALVMPTPAYRQNGIIDVMPSLLLSTLAATVIALPIGERSTDLAPRIPPKIQVQAEQQEPSPLQRGIVGSPLPLPSTASQLSPQQHYAVTFEHPPNLLRKLLPDFFPIGQKATDSAPPLKAAVVLENPRTLIRLPLADFVPVGAKNSDSLPVIKYAVEADNWPSQLTTGIPAAVAAPIPVGIQLQDYETKPRYEVTAFATPNLTPTTLAPPAAALPQGSQVSDSAPAVYTHATPQIDDFQNLLTLNPAPPPTPVVPVTTADQPSGGYGGWERYRFYRHYELELKRRLEAQRKRGEILEELETIQEPISREIAKLLHEQERKDAERADLARLKALVAQYRESDLTDLAPRVISAYTRVLVQENFSALEALDRELKRQMEEEEMAVMLLLLADD